VTLFAAESRQTQAPQRECQEKRLILQSSLHSQHDHARDQCPANLLFSAAAGGDGSSSSGNEGVSGEAKAEAIAKVEAFKGQQNITVQEVNL
jgi:hypothetical protein